MKRKSKRPSKLATAGTAIKQVATVDNLLDALPLIAPIPTAYAIGAAMQKKLNWPDPVTIIAAVAIETAGFVAADTAAKYYEFNRTAKADETKAPAWMAYTALGFYVCVTLGMTFLYEPLAMVFPLLSAVGFWLFVLRKDQTSRVASREADRATAKAETERIKAEKKAARLAKKAGGPAIQPATAEAKPAISEPKPAFVCSCGFTAKSQPALNAHQRKHSKIIGYTVSMEPVTAEVKQ